MEAPRHRRPCSASLYGPWAIGTSLGLCAPRWRVDAHTWSPSRSGEAAYLQVLREMARPGLEPGNTTIFRESSAGDARSRNACESTALASCCAARMPAVWRGLERVWDFVRPARSQTIRSVPHSGTGRQRMFAEPRKGRSLGMAPDRRHPQPAEAPPHPGARRGLIGRGSSPLGGSAQPP